MQIKEEENKLTVDTGIDDCRICVMSVSDNGESFYEVVNNTSKASFQGVPHEYRICITKHNYIPKCVELAYIQNQTFSNSSEISVDANTLKIGSHVTGLKSTGPVVFQSGCTTINAHNVELNPGTEVKAGASLNINIK